MHLRTCFGSDHQTFSLELLSDLVETIRCLANLQQRLDASGVIGPALSPFWKAAPARARGPPVVLARPAVDNSWARARC